MERFRLAKQHSVVEVWNRSAVLEIFSDVMGMWESGRGNVKISARLLSYCELKVKLQVRWRELRISRWKEADQNAMVAEPAT